MLKTFEEAIECSPFIKRTLCAACGSADPAVLEKMAAQPYSREYFEAEFAKARSTEELGFEMRRMRRDLVASIAALDMTGRIGYDEVVSLMTEFAEAAVDSAVARHAAELAQRFGVPCSSDGRPQDLMVFGMGKLGGAELNVSSDIDLVFVYDEDGETAAIQGCEPRRTISNGEFFERLARRVIPFLNNAEGPGFVFRVDMRLRPNGDSGPIVCSSGMLEEYLYSQGRDWERFAWLKARIINKPVFSTQSDFDASAGSFNALIRPFVFRKYLDFNAITSLISLHDLVRREQSRREFEKNLDGVNVKLGAGGIREIEFLVQTIQVIRGGRIPGLRSRSTLAALEDLVREGMLDHAKAEGLRKAYLFLRNLEHRLQYVNDEQTQHLPASGPSAEMVARMYGLSVEELHSELKDVTDFVKRTFEEVFKVNEDKAESGDDWPEGWDAGGEQARLGLVDKLRVLGYDESELEDAASRISTLMSSRKVSSMSEETRSKLRGLVQFVVEGAPSWTCSELSGAASSAEVVSRFLRVLESVAGRSTYISLLHQYPEAARRVGRVLAASNTSADYIAAHPIVLDDLVDSRLNNLDDSSPLSTWDAWKSRLSEALEEKSDDQEAQMNIIRDYCHSAVFQVMVADVYGRLSVERVSDHMSVLVDFVLEKVVELSWSHLRGAEGRPKFAVIGFGKLGGKELGYQSDLDLVYLCSGSDSSGIYSRLVRKMTGWLTLQTSSGRLFSVDLRLRPNGEDGLVVSDIDYFEAYEDNADGTGAWVWEHQALTRARFVAGDEELRSRFDEVRTKVLTKRRNREHLSEEILGMRRRMLEEKRSRISCAGFFDVKHGFGGMVDVEFIVQYIVLLHSADHPELLRNLGNIALLGVASDLGIISRESSEAARSAYRRYRQWQHAVRLNGGEDAPVRVRRDTAEQDFKAVQNLWIELFGRTPIENGDD